MTINPDDAKDRLESLADSLEGLTFPTSTLRIGDAQWLAAGIRDYLAGTHKSLDSALGLIPPRGKPTQQRRHELICTVWAQMRNLTAEKIAEEVSRRYPATFPNPLDEKQIRRAVGSVSCDLSKLTPTAITALGEEIARRIS